MYEFKGRLNKVGVENGQLYIEVTGEPNHHLKWKDKNYNVFITCNDDKEVNPKDNIILKEDEKLFVQDFEFENLLYIALDKGKMISISIKEVDASSEDGWKKVIKRVKHHKQENGEIIIIEDEQIIETKKNGSTKYIVKKVEIMK